MKMKIWIEEAMKEMVEEVEKNEPMPKHWKRSVLLFCLLSAVCFQTGLALSVARIWSILIQVVLMIMLVMLVGVDGMVTMMTTMKIMTMMKKKINCCNYGAGQIALLLPHYYMLQSEKD